MATVEELVKQYETDKALKKEVDGILADNKITACEYNTYELDGTLKDENYGKKDGEVANQDFYNRAQRARLACPKYAEQLVSTGDLKKVDGISGATISYNEFKEAVTDALNQAKQ